MNVILLLGRLTLSKNLHCYCLKFCHYFGRHLMYIYKNLDAKNIESLKSLHEIVKRRKDKWNVGTLNKIREDHIGQDNSMLYQKYDCSGILLLYLIVVLTNLVEYFIIDNIYNSHHSLFLRYEIQL